MRRPDTEATDPIAAADWAAVAAALDEQGYATLPLLSAEECRALTALYDDDESVSPPHRHAAPRLWQRRVQVLSLSVAAI